WGWALPASRAAALVAAIASGSVPARAWLGVSTVPIAAPTELAELFGDGRSGALLVAGLEADSPASAAGLRVGDVLASIGDQAVAEPADLVAALDAARPGAELRLLVFRSGEKEELTAIPGARPRSADRRGRQGFGHGHGHGGWRMGWGGCGWKPGR
ncbi:MAG: PDZ domain-containing protein, partial [Spirochaetaceae bacterium]|nr:PDZ domain-containing protein [Spirochaetaceae bacterium]